MFIKSYKLFTGLVLLHFVSPFFVSIRSNNSLAQQNQELNNISISKINAKDKNISDEFNNKPLVINRKGYVNIKGPNISIVFKDVDANDALMSISKLGGYGYIYVPSKSNKNESNNDKKNNTVSVSFNDEKYEVAVNSILLAAGLQGKIEGNILFVGEDVLSKGFTPEISKIYKMNNTSAASASDYLASLGAVINKVYLKEAGTNDSKAGESSSDKNSNFSIKSYGAYQGPLKGLTGTSDARLESITLIGSKELIQLAEKYLQEIDKVQNQVALSVKILDVNVNDEEDLQNSFALKFDNPTAYILNDEGGFDFVRGDITSWRTTRPKGVSNLTLSEATRFDFLSWLSGKVASNETKVLASPTLILSETRDKIEGGKAQGGVNSFGSTSIGREFGNEAFITVGTNVITNYKVTPGEGSTPAACEAEFGVSGLTFGGKLHKINEEGFITFSLSPEISSITSTSTVGTCGLINILSVRRLDTGSIKVKSGDTLVLTGVMSDTETEVMTKWPLLGDIPLLGNLFKSKSNGIKKSELIILVTPNILDEEYSHSPRIRNLEKQINKE